MPEFTTDLDLACAHLRAGQLLALPTETVYGLAADARNAEAVARVFALKGRPSSNPLIVHLAEASQAADWAASIGPDAQRLMARFWPGPLTLVLPAADWVPRSITAGQDSVALRVPAHPLARRLLERFAGALVAPSANRYMSISPTCSAHVAQQFAETDLLILEGGECRVGLESTIVSLLPGQAPRLLREGMLAAGEIEALLGQPLNRGSEGAVRAPGQHHRHYAPGTPSWRFRQLPQEALDDPACGWLWCGQARPSAGPALDLGADPADYAQGLYAALYRLDALGLQRLLIQSPPADEAWAAVSDRLARASTPLD
ncbi:L-threonylcarbamoyladenylate synthase [Pseudomonas benzenivorans]|uniref:Threonylcarbamoyl-AMP synthase n=1 Tax=Pseudomonas benzenivorans TaxID=556533 RepID=A0ABZ0PTK4_9PSED|nr:L-threonylcarbamoyladenylate synthase [Pseudomonas benzenivorans]WPC04219.1 L-threonylcarbamoyladenylate synthase [Pseudomonas benzenivorans]